MEPVRKVKLGYDDDSGKISGSDNFEKAMNSYNRAIQTLNEYAEGYMDTEDGTGIASDARCVGSDPNGKNNESATISKSTNNYGTVNLKDTDTHYTTDQTRLKAIGAYTTSRSYNYYWLASRFVYGNFFRVCGVDSYGDPYNSSLCSVDSGGSVNSYSSECWFRPVFVLNFGVKILSGTGTSGDPYEIGL